MEHLTNSKLRMNKYSIAELEEDIRHLNMKIIVNTQTLTIDFCVKYILNEGYAQCNEEVDLLTIDYALYCQPHLDEAELENAYYKFINVDR